MSPRIEVSRDVAPEPLADGAAVDWAATLVADSNTASGLGSVDAGRDDKSEDMRRGQQVIELYLGKPARTCKLKKVRFRRVFDAFSSALPHATRYDGHTALFVLLYIFLSPSTTMRTRNTCCTALSQETHEHQSYTTASQR